ncbi:MAG: hypothetical protein AB7G37_11195 [Solirubrobacteraceae bacterium]
MTAASPTVFAAGTPSFASPWVSLLAPARPSVLTGGQAARVGAVLGPAAVACRDFVLLIAVGSLVDRHRMTTRASETRDPLSTLRLDRVLPILAR